MSVSEDFLAEMIGGASGVLETQSDNWTKVYHELTKNGTMELNLPADVPETGLNIALGMIRVLQAKAAAFDTLCEDATLKFDTPEEGDINQRMYIAGAEAALGSVKELQEIADTVLEENEFFWGTGGKRVYH
jgi:hypothetical protein